MLGLGVLDLERDPAAAIEAIDAISGRVIVTGVGKSGHIGTKLAATLASTGTPAFFVHASEASHGDLGMITQDDVVIALSWSGETQELAGIVAYTRRFKVPLVAITKSEDSTLGRAADIVLKMPSVTEACPHGLAPTTSALVQLAAGDALAIALLEYRGFTAQDFRIFHPGGRLGASLTAAQDIMHKGDALPLAHKAMVMRDAIVLMTQKGFGVLGVVDEIGHLIGIITDGDLRRALQDHSADEWTTLQAADLMTADPITVEAEVLVVRALEQMERNRRKPISVLPVVDGDKQLLGLLRLHDLVQAGLA